MNKNQNKQDLVSHDGNSKQSVKQQKIVAFLFIAVLLLSSCIQKKKNENDVLGLLLLLLNQSQTATFSISGIVDGTSVDGLVLQLNGSNDLSVKQSGSFTFSNSLVIHSSYVVTIKTNPTGQSCIATQSAGIINTNITNVKITCSYNTYSIAGTVMNLPVGKTVTLNNDAASVVVSSSGGFTFSQKFTFGISYAIVATTQNGITCTVQNGFGTITDNVNNIIVACSYNTYSITGTITGLQNGKALTLKNATASITVSNSGNFAFIEQFAYGSNYSVIAYTQPIGMNCSLQNNTGIIYADVINVSVSCSDLYYTVKANISGTLYGALTLKNTVNGENIIANTSGYATFPTTLTYGSIYNVVVQDQDVDNICTPTIGLGTIIGNTIVNVSCALCEKDFVLIQTLEVTAPTTTSKVKCSASGFSAAAVKVNAYWFIANGKMFYGVKGTSLDPNYIMPTATWKLSDMGLTGNNVSVKSSSASSTCGSYDVLYFLDANKNIISYMLIPPCSVNTANITIPNGTVYLKLVANVWGVSVLINQL